MLSSPDTRKKMFLALFSLILLRPADAQTLAISRDPVTVPANEIPVMPGDPSHVNVLAQADGYELQWWSDEKTGLFNFRRCVTHKIHARCEAPILLNGLPEKDLPKFMAYFTERLDHWGSGHLTQLASVLMGSFGTATAYIGSLAALKLFKDALPESAIVFIDSHAVRNGVHLVGAGTIGVLVYIAGKNLIHSNRQKELRRKLIRIARGDTWKLPVDLGSHALFEELVSTLRQALYEYTHGGPPFDQSDNLIFQ